MQSGLHFPELCEFVLAHPTLVLLFSTSNQGLEELWFGLCAASLCLGWLSNPLLFIPPLEMLVDNRAWPLASICFWFLEGAAACTSKIMQDWMHFWSQMSQCKLCQWPIKGGSQLPNFRRIDLFKVNLPVSHGQDFLELYETVNSESIRSGMQIGFWINLN